MEIEEEAQNEIKINDNIKEENNIEDISANELYSRFEKWNKDITEQMIKEKKDKRKFKKLKEMLIKFNRMPTPIEGVELIDIKLSSRIAEDDIFLEEDFIAEHMRRGESLFYNKNNNTYDYARFGLPKFFDYKKKFDQENQNDKLQEKRVVGNMIKISEKNKENVKYLAYLTTKVNGENFQVSYNKKYSCWIIASKNVSMAIKNNDDINFYKDFNNFKDYIEVKGEKEEKEEFLDEKEKKKLKNKEKKKEKKRKKQERLERRKKGKENTKEENEEEEEEEKQEENENKINIENNQEKKEENKNNKKLPALDRYTYAIDFAETWLNLVKERIVDKNLYDQFINELGDYTLIGESVGDKKREHILIYEKRDIIFYSIINNKKLLSENCLPLSKSFDLFKKYNLTYTPIQPSEKYNTLTDLFSFINTQYDIIFDKSLQESGEGNVVYFSCEINGVESVQNLGKLKTFEYRFLRKIREKCKAIYPLDKQKIENEVMIKYRQKMKKKEKKKKNEEKNKENEKEEEEKDKSKIDKLINDEIKAKNKERERKMESLVKKLKNQSLDLLREVTNSKYNDKTLKNKFFDFGEYVLKYRLLDSTHYFDVFASFIEIMKEKFEQNVEINEQLVNEIKKKFEGLINLNDNEKKDEEEDDKEDAKED